MVEMTKKEELPHISKRIIELRKRLGMSQLELATLVGVTAPAITMWETGKRFPRGKHLKNLAKALRVSESDILDDTKIQAEAKIHPSAPLEMVTNQRHELISLIGSLSDSEVAALIGPIKNLIRLKAPINKDKPGS